jgi:hypothetical protein
MSHEDPLDALLKAGPYIDDAGFTQRVMTKLPPQRSVRRVRRTVLLCAGLAAGAVFLGGTGRGLWAVLSSGQPSWVTVAAMVMVMAVGVGTGISVALREAEG